MKDSRPNLPRPSQIVNRMVQGRKYTPTQISFMFNSNETGTAELLSSLVKEKVLCSSREKGREKLYHLPEFYEQLPEVAEPRPSYAFSPSMDNSLTKKKNDFIAGCMATRR